MIKRFSSHQKNDHGDSLIEVVVATVILAIFGLVILGAIVSNRPIADKIATNTAILNNLASAAQQIQIQPLSVCDPGVPEPYALSSTVAQSTNSSTQPVNITTTTLPIAQLGIAYSTTLTATGGSGANAWNVTPALPSGMTLNSSTGVISGTPTAANSGRYKFVVTNAGGTDFQFIVLTVVSISVQVYNGSSWVDCSALSKDSVTGAINASGQYIGYTINPTSGHTYVPGDVVTISGIQNSVSITGISGNGAIVTYSTANTNGLTVGQSITISGATTTGFNGKFLIATITSNTNFTVASSVTGTSSTATGTYSSPFNITSATVASESVCGSPITAISGNGTTVTVTAANTLSVGNKISIFGAVNPVNITAIATTASNIVFSTANTTGLAVGQAITISGSTNSAFNGTFTITALSANTSFTVAQPSTNTVSITGLTASSPAAGSVTYNTANTSNLFVGEPITIANISGGGGYNGTFSITAINANTSFTVANATTGSAGGFPVTAWVSGPTSTATGLPTVNITGISGNGSTVTYSTANTSGLVVGQSITISNATSNAFNGTYTIAGVTTNSNFTVASSSTGTSSTATGTPSSPFNMVNVSVASATSTSFTVTSPVQAPTSTAYFLPTSLFCVSNTVGGTYASGGKVYLASAVNVQLVTLSTQTGSRTFTRVIAKAV